MARPKAEPVSQTPFLDRDLAQAQEFAERTRQRVLGAHKPRPLPRFTKAKLRRKHHLVIGDSHAHPDDPNYRFEWLGRMIADRAPDVVVDIGDSADLPSLFGYDKGARGPTFEGRRYWQDIDCYVDAKQRLGDQLGPKPPRLVKVEGNHEYRITRVLEAQPILRGVVGHHNLMDKELGWEVYPYGQVVDVDGLLYCHAFQNPRNGREITGVVPARALVQHLPGSACRVQGHSHILQLYEDCDVVAQEGHGRKITAIHTGCFFDPRSLAHRWAGLSTNRWRSGILELWVDEGQVLDLRWTAYQTVESLYA